MPDDRSALDPRAARLLHMLEAGDAATTSRPSPLERRESLRGLADLAADPPPPGVTCEGLSCPAADGVRLDLRRYTPEIDPEGAGSGPRPAMLYLHGGGWVAGDLETHAGVCGALAASSDCVVFALAYRRPPEHPFPGPIRDALDALAWLAREASRLGIDARRLVLAGDSAGANLAAACLVEERASPVALLLLICPILDLPLTTGSRERFGHGFFLDHGRLAADAEDYLQGADPADPQVSPLRARSLTHLPPTLIHAATCDPFRDEALAYAGRLEAAGVPVRVTVHPGMIHYFYALPRAIPFARSALAEIGTQVRSSLTEARDARGPKPSDQPSASSE
ncbi:alpha/beta hydrolase [Caulobacter sp. S45]|uniref:alpha/beta hydrolase n=1 Tax=Caulobacter sp. S45 TaxID=1641861 RepID=UPI001C2DB6ED|nr:alpha/beta hydrolase [Caulobacter sp. S45]